MKKKLEREKLSIRREIQDIKRQARNIPSQLSKSDKRQAKKELTEKKIFFSEMGKVVSGKIKDIEKKKKEEKQAWKQIKKKLSKKVTSKRILKDSKATVTIKERQPAEYISTFFKDEMEEAKNAMFFK